jgi:uncharacterized protein YndB with AHSA1/START domain
MDATLSTINGEPTLRFERRLRHRPATVWRAVSDPAEMKHWFPATVEAELRPGAPMRFTFPSDAVVDGAWDGEVLEVDEPKVFMFRWNQDVLRIELIPDGDGCRLVFTQTIGGGRVGLLGAGRTAAGWDTCLDALVAQLDDVTPAERTDWLTPMEHYVEKFGLGYGVVETDRIHFARDLVWKPPADVWAVLTDGHATNPTVPAGRVVTEDAPTVLEYEWLHDGVPAGTVRWEIVADPTIGVRVELTQTVPPRLADHRARTLASWHVHLARFFAATMAADAHPWPAERFADLVAQYEDRLA